MSHVMTITANVHTCTHTHTHTHMYTHAHIHMPTHRHTPRHTLTQTHTAYVHTMFKLHMYQLLHLRTILTEPWDPAILGNFSRWLYNKLKSSLTLSLVNSDRGNTDKQLSIEHSTSNKPLLNTTVSLIREYIHVNDYAISYRCTVHYQEFIIKHIATVY